jgi:rare lipoprotein A
LAKIGLAVLAIETVFIRRAAAREPSRSGLASWYGEEHRGKLMANGKPFDPDKMTAATWFYPFGTQVRVTVVDPSLPSNNGRSVLVTITDRGPAKRFVAAGRIIDLSRAAFRALASPELGLIQVELETVLGE